MRPALFLDRDGVINVDHAYVHQVDQFDWMPGVFDTVRTAIELGYAVIVVTNQAGIARGYYDEKQFHALTDWMKTAFREAGAPLTEVYFCPYHPDGQAPYNVVSEFRKPAPGMLLQAAREHDIDLADSLLIGDQATDAVQSVRPGEERRPCRRPAWRGLARRGSSRNHRCGRGAARSCGGLSLAAQDQRRNEQRSGSLSTNHGTR